MQIQMDEMWPTCMLSKDIVGTLSYESGGAYAMLCGLYIVR
jgi:hypothetical protein